MIDLEYDFYFVGVPVTVTSVTPFGCATERELLNVDRREAKRRGHRIASFPKKRTLYSSKSTTTCLDEPGQSSG
jgi:hypothetical protein